MKGLTKRSIARGILPYATTILSISLAATLRVEHACSNGESYEAARKPFLSLPSDSILLVRQTPADDQGKKHQPRANHRRVEQQHRNAAGSDPIPVVEPESDVVSR